MVPHGHFAEWHPAAPSRVQARRALGFPSAATVVLYFGLIRGYKGVEELVSVFRDLPSSDLRLAIVGKPKTEDLGRRLWELTGDDQRVSLDLQFAQKERLVQYIAASDVVALPYTHSLTSGSAILAASLGRPIIAPSTGCLIDFSRQRRGVLSPGEP